MIKYAVVILSLLMTVPCHAQGDRVFVIKDFSKLLQSQISPYLIPAGGARQARNLRANEEFGALAKRRDMLTYGTIGDYKVTSLHRYYLSDDTKRLLATGSTYIKYGTDDSGSFTTLTDQMTDGYRFTWVTYKDIAIGCNGIDRCKKWDGATSTTANTDAARTADNMMAELGAPFAELNTGSNLDASSWYQYKIMFYNGTTTYYSSAVSNPIQTGSTVRDVYLTDIPLGPSGTTARYIYRTEGQATRAALATATFKLAITISNNTAVVQADTIADGSLTTEWSTTGKTDITPPIAKFATIHRERLWLANSPDYQSYLYWSDTFKPDIFPIANYEYIRPDDGDEITFIREQLGNLVIGKTNTISKFLTQNASTTNWRVDGPFSFVGCPAPFSVASSPLGIFYLGWGGIYLFNGESSQLISDKVTNVIEDISISNIDEAAGYFHKNEYHLAFSAESTGASENDMVLVLDTTRDAYVIDDKELNCFEAFDSGTDYGALYSGSSDDDGYVLAQTASLSQLILNYKSDLEAGTKDSIVYAGTENSPTMEIGWGITIDSTTMSGVTLDSVTYDTATINMPGTTGYWYSPTIQVDATDYEKLYWNESLGSYGNVTFAIRSAASTDSIETGTFSDELTDPAGSDLSGITANDVLQLRASLTTSDITESPYIVSSDNFVIKLVYSRVGTSAEDAVSTIWESGYMDFGIPDEWKRITAIEVYYTGTSGTMNVQFENSMGDIDLNFDIDLSVEADDDTEDRVTGNDLHKIFKFEPDITSGLTPIGKDWKFKITENGIEEWKVYQILVRYVVEAYY